MKKNLLLSLMIWAAAFTNILFSQNAASATWALSSASTTTVVTSGTITAASELFKGTEVNGYTGTNSSQRVRMAGTNNTWAANLTSQIDTVYIQFAVGPKSGNNFTVNSIFLAIGAASTNTMKANIYYSTDPTFATKTAVTYSTGNASNYLLSTALTQVTSSPNVQVNDGQTFYVRIYPWHESATTSSGKYMCIQNVVVSGNAIGLPRPASITWNLTTPDSQKVSVTSGNVVGQKENIGAGPNGMVVASYNSNGQRLNQGAFGWKQETTQDDARYIEFNAALKSAGDFNITNVSFNYGGAGSTNAMNSNVYYSTDNWATRTQLNSDVGPLVYPNSTMGAYTKTLNVTISFGQNFSVRIYPYWVTTTTTSTSKYAVHNTFGISGMASGSQIELPAIITTKPTNISTTTLVTGGSISSDGGDLVIARGVCWGTTTNPTISSNKTVDGAGTGSFTSSLIGLAINTKFYIRAYATNSAGTAYGNLDSVKTLATVILPTLSTTTASSIMVTTAVAGGNITDWGGADVTLRGVCWNTTGSPTMADNKTFEGSGTGTFTSSIKKLASSTKYFVRAYAINPAGVAYGNEITFTTQVQAPNITKTVSKDGSGDYTTVQAAFDAVPDNYTGTYTIFVKNGTYKEKLLLSANKVNVVLQGESRDNTILTYDDYAGKPGLGTSTSQSVAIDANDFMAKDITFQNTVKNDGTFANQQAVALRTNGDRQIYLNCKILGYQDTYYTYGAGRIYNKNCYIEGSVDFIFGKSIAVFDNCTINCNRNNSVLTAAATDPSYKFGYVFFNCTLTTNTTGFDGTPITYFFLGRPWQGTPQVVYIRCSEPANLDPAGWTTMQVTPLLYAEYNCYGPGYKPTQRTTIWGNAVKQLTDAEAVQYTIPYIFARSSGIGTEDWTPQIYSGVEEPNKNNNEIPKDYSLQQNYPNPFNPSTTIKYSIPQSSLVKINLYDVLGKQIKTLVNEEKSAGYYEVKFDASNLASGIYFYSIQAGEFMHTKKMILMK